MRHILLISFLLLTFPIAVYSAQNRVALVIGNGAYRDAPLRNPVNDAQTMNRILKKVGFKVDILLNKNKRDLIDAIRIFGNKLRKSEAALFYFSGHGIQHDGRNWLIPIGADINREKDIEFEGLNVERILYEMEGGSIGRVNIIIFDACRTNPTFRSFRSANRGLAFPRVQPEGSILAFSTTPGKVAYDGDGINSPYVVELRKHLLTPGLKIEEVFKRVRVGVKKRTARKPSPQIPWENTSLEGDFYFIPTSTANAISSSSYQTTVSTESSTFQADENAWKDIENSTDIQDFRFFLEEFPDSNLANAARFKLKRLEKEKLKLLNANKERTGTLYKYSFEDEWSENTKGNYLVKYNGKIKNGIPNGHGIYNIVRGESEGYIYKGDFKNGISHGKGKIIFGKNFEGDIFEGDFKLNKFDGNGTYIWRNGNKYDGQWKNGKRNGYGKLITKHGEFSGNWKDGKTTGEFYIKYSNFDWYSGGYENMREHGRGEYYWKSGKLSGFSYKGYWKNGKEWAGYYYNKYGRIHSEVRDGVLVK